MSKSFKLDGRRLALIGVDRRVRETIGVTRLDRILEIHRTLDDVLGAAPGAG
jgi:anti-anti-sigma regulatory factor